MESSFYSLLCTLFSTYKWEDIKSQNNPSIKELKKKDHLKNILLLVLFGLVSRVLIYTLAIFSFTTFYSYDTSTEIMIPLESLSYFLQPFVRWDSLYFIQIAYHKCIYRFEQEHAFFPLYPILMHYLALMLPVNLSLLDRLAMSGLIISLFSFLLSIVLLYVLTLKMFNSSKMAFLSSILLILSPASIFLTAVYSESLFFLLSLSGMLCYSHRWCILASIFWTLSSATRSIGIFHSGFFIYDLLLMIIFSTSSIMLKTYKAIQKLLFVLISMSGFLIFERYGYCCTCKGSGNLLFISEKAKEWCLNSSDFLIPPFLYNFVQKNYWNVGFLSYYEMKQLPNFLLAAPFFIFLFYSIYRFPSFIRGNSRNGSTHLQLLLKTAPFLLEWIVVSAIVITTAHVQIVIRLFSSTFPMLYWAGSFFIVEYFEESHNNQSKGSESPTTINAYNSYKNIVHMWILYTVTYALVGVVFFACFYPPA